MSAAMGFLLGTQEWVRNICGKQAINARATEVLLQYIRVLFSQFLDDVNIRWTEKFMSFFSNIKLQNFKKPLCSLKMGVAGH